MDIPAIQKEELVNYCKSNKITLAEIITKHIEGFDYEPVTSINGDKSKITAFVSILLKRKLEKHSRKRKASIAAIVRAIFNRELEHIA